MRSSRFLSILLAGLMLLALGGVREAGAAWTAATGVCDAQNRTAGTSIACTVATANMEVGNVAVLWFAGDNTLAADGNGAGITSVTDSGGNTWIRQGCWTNSNGAAAAGATTCVATSVLTTQLTSGSSTITANFASITAKIISVREFTVSSGSTITLATPTAGTNPMTSSVDSGDPAALGAGTTFASQEYLFVRATALERAGATGTWTVSLGGWTNLNCLGTTGGTGAAHMTLCGEYRVFTGTGLTSDPTTTSDVDNASVYLVFREVGRTVLGDGTNPSNATVGPVANGSPAGTGIVDLDNFSVRSSLGTDSITGLTVTLAPAGAFNNIAEVRITTTADVLRFGAIANPASNSVVFSGGTPISATTTATDYKVRITPKQHSAMQAPSTPGLAYATTGTVTAFTSTLGQTGTDTASATITVDNASPAVPTSSSCTSGAVGITYNWTTADATYAGAVVLGRIGAAVADVPVEGTTYAGLETIGTSTVACVATAPSTTCSISPIPVGTTAQYKVFTRDAFNNYSSTGHTAGTTCGTTLNRFDVVETGNETGTNLKTRIAGASLVADVIALNAGGTRLTDFTEQVGVALVDNSGGGACNTLPTLSGGSTLSNETFAANGRKALTAAQTYSNAYRNLKFRITYPVAAPTVTSCSADPFALRPNDFLLQVRDANRTTAGTTNNLTNTAATPFAASPVHNAGRPFRVDATARTTSLATTSLYAPTVSTQPAAVVSACVLAGSACTATLGSITRTGSFNVTSGVIDSSTVSYDNVGAFILKLQDTTWSDIDLADTTPVSTTADRYIEGSLTVGRFVPEHFTVETGATVTPRTDIGACSGSSFTYMDERMSLGFTLTARAFVSVGTGPATTAYAGTLGRLDLSSFSNLGMGAKSGSTYLTSRIDSGSTSSGTWTAGAAPVTVSTAIRRASSPDTPDGPFSALGFGIVPSEPDTVAMNTLDFDGVAPAASDRKSIGVTTDVRYGRLRVGNAMGSEKLALSVPFEVQHWSGTGFVTNTADSCTTIPRNSIALGSYTGSLAPSPNCKTFISVDPLTFNLGRVTASLSAPSVVGSVLLTPQLHSTAAGNSCDNASSTPDAIASAVRSYLLGRWNDASNPDVATDPTDTATKYDDNPSGRAAFGIYGTQPSNFIYFRENH